MTALRAILFVGRAQEKTNVLRTQRRRNPITGKAYPWLVPDTAMVNHFYFYGFDDDFGLFFIKFATYFPYVAKCYLNGHEWAKRQADKAGLDYEALDNGFKNCSDPGRLQRICRSLSAAKIDRFIRKWLAQLPHPYCARDRRAGYRYDVSILQAEFSLTQVLDRPRSGRVFFESVIRDNLDLGRPDRVSLIFDRRVYTRGKRSNSRRVLHPGHHRRGHPLAPRLLPQVQDQAVPQGRSRLTNRDHHQRCPGRLQHRQTAAQPGHAGQGRLLRQPTSARRPTNQPRALGGRGRHRVPLAPCRRRRPASPGPAIR